MNDVRKPYVKVYMTDSDGNKVLMNPIVKGNPYITYKPLVIPKHSTNNKKGIKVVIVNLGKGVFEKYLQESQLIKLHNGKYKKITHYVPKGVETIKLKTTIQ